MSDAREIFERIYLGRLWGDPQCPSVSGPGSTMEATAHLRRSLAALLIALDARKIIDAPCGDAHWISHLAPGFESYLGVEIVPQVAALARKKLSSPRCVVELGDVASFDFPSGFDLLLSRDCLGHLSEEHALRALGNFKRSGARYFASTTFPSVENRDVATGGWRPLNLCAPPYGLPDPIAAIHEGWGETDKTLAVWELGRL